MLELIRKKQTEPLEALGSAEDKTKAVGLWEQVLTPIREANADIQMAVGQISNYTIQLDGENAVQLQQQVLRFQAIKRRYDPQAGSLIGQLATARTGVNSADKTKVAARESLDSLMTSILDRYQTSINALLKKVKQLLFCKFSESGFGLWRTLAFRVSWLGRFLRSSTPHLVRPGWR